MNQSLQSGQGNSGIENPLHPSGLLRRHFLRLKHQRDRILKQPEGKRKEADVERWEHLLRESYETFQRRERMPHTIEYDPELPITQAKDEIIDLLIHRQVVIICGETGSGKSTQLPKLCLEAGLGKHGWIGHTQPRRIAARSVATRIADELDSSIGGAVGFKVRFNDQTKPESLIKLMTDGVLLAEIQRDRYLDAYDCIIIDEAHERSLNIDLLMAYLQRLLPKRPDLRVVITSATIDAERFSEHFVDAIGPAPIVLVEGRSYPVEVRYRGAIDQRVQQRANDSWVDDTSIMDRFCDGVDELLQEGYGDILAFFPTERDIRDAAKVLRGHLTQRSLVQQIEVLPLYARLTEAEQQRVFQPHKKMRIVLATNVAESSLTVPGIRYVIDTGTARVSRFAAKSKVQRLPIEPIPQASANQRSGRCGRLGPGIAIRLYDEQDYLSRPPFATPEIRRSDLASTIIHTKSLGIDDFESLPWLDPPRPDAVREGMNVLQELGAIDAEERLTTIGRKLARWPVDPRVGRMILEAEKNGCLNEMLIIAAAIETQDPRMRPPEKSAAADEAHLKFKDPQSDFLAYLRIWEFYQSLREQLGRSRLAKAMQENFLSMVKLREWADVHRQLLEQCKESKIAIPKKVLELPPLETEERKPSSLPRGLMAPRGPGVSPGASHRGLGVSPKVAKSISGETPEPRLNQQPPTNQQYPKGYDSLHLSLLAGLLPGIATIEDTGKYRGAHNLEMTLWPGSGIRTTKPKWILSAERIETTQRYARTAARIEQEWIERVATHLIKYSYEEAHFSRKQGKALVMRKGTLFGLPVSPRIAVPLAPLNPTLARTLLIEFGLAGGELVSRAKFWQHNQQLMEEVRSLADRTRRRDLIIDPQTLVDFYEARIPQSVVDRSSLETWDRSLQPQGKAKEGGRKAENAKSQLPSPYLTWDDIIIPVDRREVDQHFPERLSLGVTELDLKYRYEPGHDSDGVSVAIPTSVLHQIHAERLEWLVPGLLEEKLVCLIKSLPKRLRRQLVPVPDNAKRLMPQVLEMFRNDQPFWKGLCDVLTQDLHEVVKREDFDLNSLPQHLRMRIEVLDDSGKVQQAGRDLAEIQGTHKDAVSHAVHHNSPKTSYDWTREKLETWDIDELPRSVIEMRGGVRVEMYPTLLSDGEKTRTTTVDHPLMAEQLLRVNWIRLLHRIERKEIRSHLQHMPQFNSCSLWLSDRLPGDKLREWLGDLMARLAFLDVKWHAESLEPAPRTKVEFEIARIKRIERLSMAASEIGRWLPKLAEANHKVRGLLERAPGNWKGSTEQIREQLLALWAPGNVWNAPWCVLKEFPRYLQSLAIRIDKLKSTGSAKDLALEGTARKFWDDYRTRWEKTQPSAATLESVKIDGKESLGGGSLYPTGKLSEYRWCIEELRVSIHSQNLGTRISISPKRLEKMQSELSM